MPHPDAPVPSELAAALEDAPDAGAVFAGLPPSNRWEYVRWAGGAVKPETQQRRAGSAVGRLRAYAAAGGVVGTRAARGNGEPVARGGIVGAGAPLPASLIVPPAPRPTARVSLHRTVGACC